MSINLQDGLANQSIDHVLEDLLARFVINVPPEDSALIERLLFQVEEAHWFYLDFVRQINPNLLLMKKKLFSQSLLEKCPLFWKWGDPVEALAKFGKYKSTIPVRGVALMNQDLTKVVLVQGIESLTWSFPRGKISKDESDLDCAIREVREETGFDARNYVNEDDYLERRVGEKNFKIYLARGVPEDTHFEPLARNEIDKIQWFSVKKLSKMVKDQGRSFFILSAFMRPLNSWINSNTRGNESEEIAKLEQRLKTLMGLINKPAANADAGRELLNILQVPQRASLDLKPIAPIPQHLQNLYGPTVQMPIAMPPPLQHPVGPGFLPVGPYSSQPQMAAPSAQSLSTPKNLSSNSKELLLILKGPSSKNSSSPLTQVSDSTISILKRDANGAKPGSPGISGKTIPLESLFGSARSNLGPQNGVPSIASKPAQDGPLRASSELLNLLRGPRKETAKEPEPKPQLQQAEEPKSAQAAPQLETLLPSGFMSILKRDSHNGAKSDESNHRGVDKAASGELLGLLKRPETVKQPQPPKLESSAPLTSAQQIMSTINRISSASQSRQHTPHPDIAPHQEDPQDFEDFADFEDFDDLDNDEDYHTVEHSAAQNSIINSIANDFADVDYDQDEQVAYSKTPVAPDSEGGASLLQMLKGQPKPKENHASAQNGHNWNDTYGRPASPAHRPLPNTASSFSPSGNGAELLLILKKQPLASDGRNELLSLLRR